MDIINREPTSGAMAVGSPAFVEVVYASMKLNELNPAASGRRVSWLLYNKVKIDKGISFQKSSH